MEKQIKPVIPPTGAIAQFGSNKQLLTVRNQATAEAWVARARALNERIRDLNDRIGQQLQQIAEDSEGELVTALVEWGNKYIRFAQEILEGFKQLADGIQNVISLAGSYVDDVVSFIGKVISLG